MEPYTRSGMAVHAVTDHSEHGFCLIRRGWARTTPRRMEWRVNVRHGDAEHTATGRTLEAALQRALTWLRARGEGGPGA